MTDVASPGFWIQLGSTGLLCIIVLLELRQIRPVLQGVREVLSALLERDRIRSERKREPSDPPPPQNPWPADESSNVLDIIERQRAEAKKKRAATSPLGSTTYHHRPRRDDE